VARAAIFRAVTLDSIAVDWSGAATARVPGLWIAVVRNGRVVALWPPGSRAAATEWLCARVAEATPCVIGLDFAFGLPAWWCGTQSWAFAPDVWRAAAADGESWLAACDPPFWGRAGRSRPHERERGLRVTDRLAPGAPKSPFQIGGAGSVGTGSIRGMPTLLALAASGAAIWPMMPPTAHTIVEVYPSALLPAGCRKSRRDDRAAVLDGISARRLSPAHRALACASEDAFDAVVAALSLSDARGTLPTIPLEARAAAALEGWIWSPPD
jgi:hypothetical protein